jgi:hypothetical protein
MAWWSSARRRRLRMNWRGGWSWYDHTLKVRANSVGKAAARSRQRCATSRWAAATVTRRPKGLLFHGGRVARCRGPGRPQARTADAVSTSAVTVACSRRKKQSWQHPATPLIPKLPVPTIGGNISSGDGIMLQGAWDQRGGEHVWNWTAAAAAVGRAMTCSSSKRRRLSGGSWRSRASWR